MGRLWPALDIDAPDQAHADRVLAIADDFGPTAIEEIGPGSALRIFFPTFIERDSAVAALGPRFHASPIDIPDDDWARRSQEKLTPVTVGRITVAPPWHKPRATSHEPPATSQRPITIVIVPSMGFGTGHHATTRLCLAALQAIDLTGAFVLDVGTGSGVLAIAAIQLGAARALGVDDDPDAVQSANENLALNPMPHPGQTVSFAAGDLMTLPLPPADVVTANLTGALLIRAAGRLRQAVRPGGALIVSGLLTHERDEVVSALADVDLNLVGSAEEEGWTTITARFLSKD